MPNPDKRERRQGSQTATHAIRKPTGPDLGGARSFWTPGPHEIGSRSRYRGGGSRSSGPAIVFPKVIDGVRDNAILAIDEDFLLPRLNTTLDHG
jgi:hypothetical protein